MKRTDWFRLIALSTVWGGSFLFFRILATELPPLKTVLSRVAIGAFAIFLYLRARGVEIRIPRAQWGRLAVLAILNNVVPFSLFAWGESRVSSGTASILNARTPMFVVLITGLVLRTEKLTWPRVLGVLCGIAGVAVLVGPDALVGADLLGQAACLGAALCYGFALPWGRRITGLNPPVLAMAQLTAATLILLPLVMLFDRPWSLVNPDVIGWVAIAGLGLLCTGLAYIIFFAVLASAGATNLSLVTLMVPVSALLLGRVVLDEPITSGALGGMALIALGLAAIDGRLLRWISRCARL